MVHLASQDIFKEIKRRRRRQPKLSNAERLKNYQELEGENLKRVIEGHKIVKAKFEKRLNTYLKKYGLTKVHAWSYWRDA